MRMLTKGEACRELGLSLSTLDRRIAAGDLPAKREPLGRRHRVYVVLDGEPPGSDNLEPSATALAVARERVRGLEAQVALLQEQLERERQGNAELANELREVQNQRRPWRWFRQRSSDRLSLTGPAGRGMMDSKTI